LPLLFIGSVAGETFVRKQGPDFAIEINGLEGRGFSWRSGESSDESKIDERKKHGARPHKVGSFHCLSL
jgi:hypothetical protein